jgi:hypothetical protein
MTCRFVPVSSWSDAADIATTVSMPIAFLAVGIAGYQIVQQLKGARREAAFEVFLDFTERFRVISELRRMLNSRFDHGDKSVNVEAIYNFYSQYWNLQINQWEMFRAGLLPSDIYANWLIYTHDNIHGPFALNYFGPRGKKMSLAASEAFETVAKKRMLRGQAEACSFFEALAAIPHSWSLGCGFDVFDDPARPTRLQKIKSLLTERQKRYKHSKIWELN